MKQREFMEITLPQQVAPDFLIPNSSKMPKPAGWIHLENPPGLGPVPPAGPKQPQAPPPRKPKPPQAPPPPHLIALGQASRAAETAAQAAPENAGDQAQALPPEPPVQEPAAQEPDDLTEASVSEISSPADTPRTVDVDMEAARRQPQQLP